MGEGWEGREGEGEGERWAVMVSVALMRRVWKGVEGRGCWEARGEVRSMGWKMVEGEGGRKRPRVWKVSDFLAFNA